MLNLAQISEGEGGRGKYVSRRGRSLWKGWEDHSRKYLNIAGNTYLHGEGGRGGEGETGDGAILVTSLTLVNTYLPGGRGRGKLEREGGKITYVSEGEGESSMPMLHTVYCVGPVLHGLKLFSRNLREVSTHVKPVWHNSNIHQKTHPKSNIAYKIQKQHSIPSQK